MLSTGVFYDFCRRGLVGKTSLFHSRANRFLPQDDLWANGIMHVGIPRRHIIANLIDGEGVCKWRECMEQTARGSSRISSTTQTNVKSLMQAGVIRRHAPGLALEKNRLQMKRKWRWRGWEGPLPASVTTRRGGPVWIDRSFFGGNAMGRLASTLLEMADDQVLVSESARAPVLDRLRQVCVCGVNTA